MRKKSILVVALAIFMLGMPPSGSAAQKASSPQRAAARAAQRPNIIFILADDLGYGDVGVTYQNARAKEGKPAFVTPHIDALAADGITLRQHYTGAPVCAPARASLMTGLSQGHCNVRDNQFDKAIAPGLTLASMLKQGGYATAAIGKWGLGGHAGSGYPAHPMKRGFDQFFGFMAHRTGHVYYHDAKHPLMEGYEDIGAKYENVYSTDLFTARAKKYITDQHESHPDQPFFLYLAYTAVHNALQVPGGAYPSGGGARGGLHWPLAPSPQTRDTYIFPDYANKDWTEPMKRYATMAHRLDDGVGDVLQLLKDLKIDDNTLVVFTSDNGPANEGGADPRLFSSWGPFDGFKRDCWEGGVREPTFVRWPGHVPAGKISDRASGFWDWMPTFAELAGLPAPAHSDGVSILPTLLQQGKQPGRGYLYIEYFHGGKNKASKDVFARKHVTGRGQQQLVRIGDYVGVRVQIKKPSDPLRLYDVMKDPHEDHNLASDPANAKLLARMTDLLVTARRPDPDAKRPYDDVPLPNVRIPAAEAPTPTLPRSTGGGSEEASLPSSAERESGNSLHRYSGGGLGRGLVLSRFDGDWPWTPDFMYGSLKPAETTTAHAIGMNPSHATDQPFGLSFTGYLKVPKDGQYTFTGSSDAGLQVWLHDCHLIDSDEASTDHPIAAKVNLKAGLHPIRVFYRHHEGKPALSLRWAGPGVPDQPIPADALFTAKRSQ